MEIKGRNGSSQTKELKEKKKKIKVCGDEKNGDATKTLCDVK
jgi:hypothetical protein